MKTIIYKGKNVELLNQKEKALELGMSIRTFWEYLRNGKYTDITVIIPGTTKKWYLKEEDAK